MYINMSDDQNICMYGFCECKYSFKVNFLKKQLEVYTRVHKKGVPFCCFFNHNIGGTYRWSQKLHSCKQVNHFGLSADDLIPLPSWIKLIC